MSITFMADFFFVRSNRYDWPHPQLMSFFMFLFQHSDFRHPADYHRVKVPKSNRFLIAIITVVC